MHLCWARTREGRKESKSPERTREGRKESESLVRRDGSGVPHIRWVVQCHCQ